MIFNYTLERDQYTGMVTIARPCVFTGEPYSVTVRPAEWANYMNGMHAEQAFPDLNLDDREFLISGISPKGWATLPPEK